MYNGQTVNSDIWLLYEGRMIFHSITHDTDKNQLVFLFETQNYVVIKQHINYFKTKIS